MSIETKEVPSSHGCAGSSPIPVRRHYLSAPIMDISSRSAPGNLEKAGDSSDEEIDIFRFRDIFPAQRSSSPAPQKVKSPSQRRRNSTFGATPDCHFGPKASIMKNSFSLLTIQDPGTQRFAWSTPPENVLIIKKLMDESVFFPFKTVITWLIEKKDMTVFVEESVLSELKDVLEYRKLIESVHTFKKGYDCLNDKIDLILSLGGDGTLLYASGLFQQRVPPVLSFNLGSLGFLTPFQFEDFEQHLTKALEGNVCVMLRSRLRCVLSKKINQISQVTKSDAFCVDPPFQSLVLNEVVIDRGPSSYISNLDLYINKRLVTSVQGDGLIISTPTGSTAYACAAGASMVHPNVPAILIVPICPHSLSFRPIVVPAGVEITVMLSPAARHTAWVSFDGKNKQQLQEGDNIRITTSIYPVPAMCSQDQIVDWFSSLSECLHWNVRQNRTKLPSSHSSSDTLLSDSDTNGVM